MAVESRWMPCQLTIETNICSSEYDGIILVSGSAPGFDEPEPFKTVLYAASQIDSALGKIAAVLPINLPAKRLIYSPTGPLNMDYDDVRSFAEAATRGIERALKAGVRCPLLALLPDVRFENVEMVTLLGALDALYVPLEVREIGPDRCYKACRLGVWSPICNKKLQGIVKLASALESGRYVARDIGGADPERMAAPRVEQYVAELFCGSNVTVQVISDEDTLHQEYPLFAAVNRAASVTPRHAGRIIFLTYEPPNPTCVLETLLFVGKGVTYDTGGADIKYGGMMSGMSRDKCGAAVCAGFMQVVNLLQPPTVKVAAVLCVVRNSVGENCYVSDEVITAKSGMRIRVGNTDAEGRMAMADALCHIKEMALRSVNPHIFTIATLTGHADLAAGNGYSIAMDNAVARLASNAEKIQTSGEAMGDPFEVSKLRREDFHFHDGKAEGDDIIQAVNILSSKLERGHQAPAAFLIRASGLDKHGIDSEKPLKYCHLDVAASAGSLPDKPTGQPIIALAKCFLFEQIEIPESNDIPKHGACSCSPLKYTNIDIAGHLPNPHSARYSGNPLIALSYCYLIQGKCLTIRNQLPCEMQYVCEVDYKPVCIPSPCQPCVMPNEGCQQTCQLTQCQGTPAQTLPQETNCQMASGPPISCQEQVMVVEPVCPPNVRRNGLNTGT